MKDDVEHRCGRLRLAGQQAGRGEDPTRGREAPDGRRWLPQAHSGCPNTVTRSFANPRPPASAWSGRGGLDVDRSRLKKLADHIFRFTSASRA